MFRHFMNEEREGRCGGKEGSKGERDFGRGRGFEGWMGHMGHRGRWGRGEGFGPMGRGGFGGGRERMFDSGVMRLVILQQLAEEPSYGYQLIKKLEERMAGGYRPSAGVIYPTLTMLEEQGLTSASTNDAGKKVYSVTEEGHAFLKENQERLDELKSLMNEAGRGFKRGRSPELMESFMKLREAVAIKAKREGVTPEQLKKIAEIITAAARSIDEL